MTTTTQLTIAELARATKAELIRRGPVAGELAVEKYGRYDEFDEFVITYEATKADCKVCVLGAAGAAAFGDPNLGYVANRGHSFETVIRDGLADVEYAERYARFVELLAQVVVEDGANDEGEDVDTVTTWFDKQFDEDPTVDDSEKLGPVLAALDEVARRSELVSA